MNTVMTQAELGSRLVIGSVLILAVLLNADVPAWMALIAPYFFFTAMLRRDPVAAVVSSRRGGVTGQPVME